MFPIIVSEKISKETLEELFNREVRLHPSHVQNYESGDDDELFIFDKSDESGRGYLIYLTYKELKELDEMNVGNKRVTGKCDNNIQCYFYIRNNT